MQMEAAIGALCSSLAIACAEWGLDTVMPSDARHARVVRPSSDVLTHGESSNAATTGHLMQRRLEAVGSDPKASPASHIYAALLLVTLLLETQLPEALSRAVGGQAGSICTALLSALTRGLPAPPWAVASSTVNRSTGMGASALGNYGGGPGGVPGATSTSDGFDAWSHAAACLAFRGVEALCARRTLRLSQAHLAMAARAPLARAPALARAAHRARARSPDDPAAVASIAAAAREASTACSALQALLRHRSGGGARFLAHAAAATAAIVRWVSRADLALGGSAAGPAPPRALAAEALSACAEDLGTLMEELVQDKRVASKYVPGVLATYIEEGMAPGGDDRGRVLSRTVGQALRLGALCLYGACGAREMQQVSDSALSTAVEMWAHG